MIWTKSVTAWMLGTTHRTVLQIQISQPGKSIDAWKSKFYATKSDVLGQAADAWQFMRGEL